jgi:hypothetical protein
LVHKSYRRRRKQRLSQNAIFRKSLDLSAD